MDWKQWVLPKDRQKIRKKRKYSLVSDVFLHSSVKDYYALRLIYNIPIGMLIGFAIYTIAWHRLNFGDFNAIYREVFKWGIISGLGIAFAISPVLRCATICVCLGGLSKSGQGFLTLYMVEQIHQGPINNILYNFELTSQIVVCHLELQGQLAKQKLSLLTGPVEALFEKHFGTAASIGQKMLSKIKSIIEPFQDQLELNSEEDELLDQVISGEHAIAERERIDNEEEKLTALDSENISTSASWISDKSGLGKANNNRMWKRCQSTYAMAERGCRDRFSDAKSKCFTSLPIIGLFVCWQYDVNDFCQPRKMEAIAKKACDKFINQKDTEMDMDARMKQLNNITEELDKELRVNVHFKVIEEPRTERLRMLSEITAQLTTDINFIKVISQTLTEILSALMVFMVYSIFHNAVVMVKSYLSDIEFKNVYLTQYFWRIDHKRMMKGQIYLGKLKKAEKRAYNLQHPMSRPSVAEIKSCWQPLLQFCVLLFVVIVIVTFDHMLFDLLTLITNYVAAEAEQTGQHIVDVRVVGNGSIAEIVRELIEFNYTNTQQRELSNKICLVNPREPNQEQFLIKIVLPLLIMFLLQVLLNYILKRLILFYVIAFIFRKRGKQRIVYLYNQVISQRMNDRRLARARLKYLVKNGEYKPIEVTEYKWRISKLLFKLRKVACALCQSKYRLSMMENCEDCRTYYCLDCLEIQNWKCLVCKTRRKYQIQE